MLFYLTLSIFDAQDGSQSRPIIIIFIVDKFRSEQEHIGSSSTQSRSRYLSPDHHWLIKDYNGYINDSPDDHWERGCCKQLCKRPLYHWEGANRGEYFHMFIFAYLNICIFAYLNICILGGESVRTILWMVAN